MLIYCRSAIIFNINENKFFKQKAKTFPRVKLQTKAKELKTRKQNKRKSSIILNEKLYTISSEDALKYFQENPEDYQIYHDGFRIQAEKWPANPNEIILKELQKEKYKNKVVADLGCGEAFLAQNLHSHLQIHSFDLVKHNEHITVADIANLPLQSNSCDIAVFCLSLMGKNFIDFIKEAARILKEKGILIVAEITSRIVDFIKFIEVFKLLGFEMTKNKDIFGYFKLLVFKLNNKDKVTKNKIKTENSEELLKPCIYKKR